MQGTEVFLTAYLNALQGTTRHEVLEQHSFSFQEAVKTIVDVMMNGILTETGRKQFSQQSFTIYSTRTNI